MRGLRGGSERGKYILNKEDDECYVQLKGRGNAKIKRKILEARFTTYNK